ncbi:hypothetical protein [Alishewanella tabrizica]|uniref:Uncharacterized protein n=1 Tax=Alishewanella tabrizica TaxID=671278 RepID=A0ABQ2WJD5_9ALTE|nr:hypothetical protein [Alishewanella tabrizica]GGW54559.1 hypothetical protein GCM10008111_08150 [Alishewanella tabrizica]
MTEIRLGFTGHRPNRLSPEHMLAIRGRLIYVFEKLYMAIADSEIYFSSSKVGFTLVSGMAAGADLAAIHAAKHLSWRLHLLLPYNRNDFIKTFSSIKDIDEFTQFLADASNVTEMDALGLLTSIDESHEVLGKYLLDNCDMLVAVWDGGESKGKGGTVDIVESAIKIGKRVIWLDTSSSEISAKISKISANDNQVTWTANLNNELNSLGEFFISN